jgi:hypothetical protein
MFNSGLDIPDAEDLYPSTYGIVPKYFYKLNFKKKIIQSLSTRRDPCNEYSKQTCYQRILYKKIFNQYGCELLMMKGGRHLSDLVKNDTKVCDSKTHLAIFDTEWSTDNIAINAIMVQCQSKQACTQTKYSMQVKSISNQIAPKHLFFESFMSVTFNVYYIH